MKIHFLPLLLLLCAVPGFCQYYDAEDSADIARIDTVARELQMLNAHVGNYGVTGFLSFVKQQYGKDTQEPRAYTFGLGLSGDILTGLSFIHLIPLFQYWSYSEDPLRLFVDEQINRDVSISFMSALMTPRFSRRHVRVFCGLGPSLHLSIVSLYSEGRHMDSNIFFTSGIGGIAGVELPLTPEVSFIATAQYKRAYYWNTLQRVFFILSVGLAV
ncbi:MAG: hypothetical protein A2487_15375 [Candidatus Raymondbacteria bacterium RifOxyC12_full_50_8]|uniref:Outer membrane protein beta-barrel domain-containing protein n=1 Tax=Candidatus Raymondbacteria bacterium RIFOXYD12_FULL_49_13 TaxID=1817890 RepID=A0A1F7F6N6_UNCRA|nr:MAG: hypothetical protein A2350_06925 [Candidatus Raymondbacteria bacterium RifOxyB12_full_50_8]OGJ93194.1 MAG: hypothetical protein A2248_17640 [Candidatus Raymondbacteria bacterium RIFOXYA2_FULL_49_16]OGJ94646.1 MAG: hypothetical protein A2487_15375 [Candidatus Raymondbacteria bacterium RifOxyC12_full_50_8]OGK02301.1 MAG: hypothetical protein A2519_16670 [Candidatus Raymondbacteria bacterium RIFOXYD12_FULL_49_13]OGP44916.1 MAG: hypothetical protein A2324_19565 [Candidatus Raymondbacteria b